MAITFQQNISEFNNYSPATSGSFTPIAAGDTIIAVSNDAVSSGYTLGFTSTGWAGPLSPPGNAAALGTTAIGYLLSASAGSQTFTITDSSANVVRCWPIEYTAVGVINNAYAAQINTPGTGAGAVAGTSVVVPTGSTLLALCFDSSSTTNVLTTPTGTSRFSGSSGGGYLMWADWAGAGASITPTFTSPGGATDFYLLVQMILNPAAGATIAWVT